jgi:hypothetical protein
MKALSTSIVLVVTVITVLVVALVVLSIFSGGISQVNTITNFKNNCITQCQITCKMGALPPTWDAEVNVQGVTGETSCRAQTGIISCTGCGGSTGSGDTIYCYVKSENDCKSSGCAWCTTGINKDNCMRTQDECNTPT